MNELKDLLLKGSDGTNSIEEYSSSSYIFDLNGISCFKTNSIFPIFDTVFIIIINDIIKTKMEMIDILMSMNCLNPPKLRGNYIDDFGIFLKSHIMNSLNFPIFICLIVFSFGF